MTDITSEPTSGRRRTRAPKATSAPAPTAQRPSTGSGATAAAAPQSGAPTPEDLVACVELLFFAYRDFTGGPDAILETYGFGRAHHRVLHFVYRNPGLRVADLLDILRITKQSLARVLKQLIDQGFIIQRTGDDDRRERRLFVSTKGGRLAEKLITLQTRHMASALANVGPDASEFARRFLFAMIASSDRAHVEALVKQEAPRA